MTVNCPKGKYTNGTIDCHSAELKIRGGIEDNSTVTFSYFSTKTYVVTPPKNRLDGTLLMMLSQIVPQSTDAQSLARDTP